MTRQPYLSVIIPAYNEAQRLPLTLAATHAYLSQQPFSSEILVVDDGSRDDTREVVRDMMRDIPNLDVIESFPNRGKGHVVRMGMLTAQGKVRLFMDADNATPVSELPNLLAKLPLGFQVVIGSRRAPGAVSVKKAPWFRRAWSWIANRVVQAGLLDGIHDTQCGFKLFTAVAAEAIFSRARTAGWGFDLEVLALARRIGYRTAEVPVRWTDDRRSRISPLRDAWRITMEFLRIRRAFRRGEYDLPAAPAGLVNVA
jgi:dolichyl-phosphate beta-glucosyltransferase